jgi:CRISPR/Cas system-associated protein endoribonuclease Cas2
MWINGHPESFHPFDMERFYVFVKCVCRYSRKQKDHQWLRQRIIESGKISNKEVVEKYCEMFNELQEFYKTPWLRIYEVRR